VKGESETVKVEVHRGGDLEETTVFLRAINRLFVGKANICDLFMNTCISIIQFYFYRYAAEKVKRREVRT
jgi:hypothetical protein